MPAIVSVHPCMFRLLLTCDLPVLRTTRTIFDLVRIVSHVCPYRLCHIPLVHFGCKRFGSPLIHPCFRSLQVTPLKAGTCITLLPEFFIDSGLVYSLTVTGYVGIVIYYSSCNVFQLSSGLRGHGCGARHVDVHSRNSEHSG